MSDEWVVTMPKLGETVTEGTIGNWLKQVGDDGRVRRPAVRGVHRQGRLGDPQPVRRRDRRDPGRRGRDRAGRHPARPDRRARIGRRAARGRRGCRRRRTGWPRRAGRRSATRPPDMGGSEGMAGEDPASACPPASCTTSRCPSWARRSPRARSAPGCKQAGDTVEFDDPLFEVSTDKVDSEIPSPYDGVLLEILVAGGRDRAGRHRAGPHRRARRGGGRRRPAAAPATRRRGPAAGRVGRSGDRRPARPPTATAGCSRRWSAGSSPRPGWTSAAITGTGAGGRIRREDVERAIAGGDGPGAAHAPPRPLPLRRAAPRPRPLPQPRPPPRPAAAPPRRPPRPTDPRDEVVTLSRMRLAVAGGHDGLAGRSPRRCGPRSRSTSTTSSRCGQKHKDRFKKETGASLSYLPFVSRAVGRRAARLPDRQLLDRHRGEDDDAAPVRQPRHRGRPRPAGPGGAGASGTPTG